MAWPSRRWRSASAVSSLLRGAEYWNLHSGGEASANFEGAWAFATGKGVLVGIVDEGVNYTHLDLAGHYATDLDYDPRDDASAQDAMPDDLDQAAWHRSCRRSSPDRQTTRSARSAPLLMQRSRRRICATDPKST